MKLSNRILGILLLISILGGFYIFYQVFFKIKLTSLEINSNIENFSGSLENLKFSKDFYCEKNKCLINGIPLFEYKLKITKKDYKNFKMNIDLSQKDKFNIFLEKKIIFIKVEDKSKSSKIQEIKKLLKQKVDFGNKKEKYYKIYDDDFLVYFIKENKLYFYNLKNNSSFFIDFKLDIKYIKKISDNLYLINTKVGSFNFNKLNKNLEYFSLFSDYIISSNNYIGIINSDDKVRLKNFDLDKGNYIISYDIKSKKKIIIKKFKNKIKKIYFENKKLFIENNLGEEFEIKNF